MDLLSLSWTECELLLLLRLRDVRRATCKQGGTCSNTGVGPKKAAPATTALDSKCGGWSELRCEPHTPLLLERLCRLVQEEGNPLCSTRSKRPLPVRASTPRAARGTVQDSGTSPDRDKAVKMSREEETTLPTPGATSVCVVRPKTGIQRPTCWRANSATGVCSDTTA